jgi:2-dehydropantoate 2-reductase
MWHKYLFIAAMSGITTLFRSPIGPIREVESGRKTLSLLVSEITSIMNAIDAPISESIETIQINKIAELGYMMKSSMQRDMEKRLATEADHLQGYLLERARWVQLEVPILETIYANLKVYEQQLLQ